MRKFICALLAVILVFSLAACSGPAATKNTGNFEFTESNYPKMGGSLAALPLGEAITAYALGISREDASKLIVFEGSTTDNYKAIVDGKFDILLAYEPSEEAKAYIAEKGAELEMTPIGADALVFICSNLNKVDSLTVDQIKDIYTGKITDWSEVGGEAGKISCIGREAGSGTRDGFESITGTKDACKLDQELTSTGGVIEAVAGNANAIGYASLSAVEGKDTVKAVTVGGVACTEETVLDGSYAIQRPFVLVTKTDAPLSTAAQAFFDYATSTAANDLIKAAGAVPVAK